MTTENFARPILSLMSTGKGYPLSTNEFIRDWLARDQSRRAWRSFKSVVGLAHRIRNRRHPVGSIENQQLQAVTKKLTLAIDHTVNLG